MILVIDTSDEDCLVGIFDGQKRDRINWQWQKDTGGEVLERIGKLLIKHNLKISGLEAIAVNQGPGSYTGLRVGITIANTLAWSLKIPVFGYSSQDIENVIKQIAEKLKKGNYSPSHFPTPIYKN